MNSLTHDNPCAQCNPKCRHVQTDEEVPCVTITQSAEVARECRAVADKHEHQEAK